MKYFHFIILVSIFYCFGVIAQTNLVSNPSFEDHTGCPNSGDLLYMANNWYNPCNWNPDYFHICGYYGYSVPYPLGHPDFQIPHTGDAYVGISTYSFNVNFREYLGQRLNTPLESGHYYYGGFYINLLNFCSHALDLLGMAIVTDSILCEHHPPSGHPYISQLNFIPQVCNTPGNVLLDTANWVMIADTFKATGGERFLAIGDFYPDSMNTIVNWLIPFSNVIAYYLIDDVFLYDLGTGLSVSDIPAREKSKYVLYPNPVRDKLFIQIRDHENVQELTIRIIDLRGKFIQEEINSHPSKIISFDLSSLKSGLYFVEILSPDGGYYNRLIKI